MGERPEEWHRDMGERPEEWHRDMGERPEEWHRDMGGLKNQVFSLWHRNMGGDGIEIWESPCGTHIPVYRVEAMA
jgi:hypothetical protein